MIKAAPVFFFGDTSPLRGDCIDGKACVGNKKGRPSNFCDAKLALKLVRRHRTNLRQGAPQREQEVTTKQSVSDPPRNFPTPEKAESLNARVNGTRRAKEQHVGLLPVLGLFFRSLFDHRPIFFKWPTKVSGTNVWKGRLVNIVTASSIPPWNKWPKRHCRNKFPASERRLEVPESCFWKGGRTWKIHLQSDQQAEHWVVTSKHSPQNLQLSWASSEGSFRAKSAETFRGSRPVAHAARVLPRNTTLF